MRFTMRSRLSRSFEVFGKADMFSSSLSRDEELSRWSLVVGRCRATRICCDSRTTNDYRPTTYCLQQSVFRFASQTAPPEKFVSRTHSAYAPCQDPVLPARPGVQLQQS